MTRVGILGVCALTVTLALGWWQWTSIPAIPPASGSEDQVTGRAALVPDTCPPLPSDLSSGVAYPSLLRMMGEPTLGCGPMVEDEVYRLVLRGGAPAAAPLSIRLSRSEGVHILIARRYAWPPDADPTRPLGVVASRIRALTDGEWRDLESALASAHFWEMPIEARDEPDAARWQLEGRRGRGYHHVERIDTGAGPFGELAGYLLRIGGFDAPPH